MKKLSGIFLLLGFIGPYILQAQPTDRPLHNFYVDKGTVTIFYRQIFTDSNSPKTVIVKKLREVIKNRDFFSELTLDSSTIFRGHLSNITSNYYGTNRKLEGDFFIVVSDGQYKVEVHNLIWDINSLGGMNTENLEGMNINNRGTEWKMFAYNIFPDIDEMLTRIFSINPLPVQQDYNDSK